MIDKELAAPQSGETRESIVTHGVVDQEHITLGHAQIFQRPYLLGQRRVDMLDEDIGFEAKAS